MSTLLGPARSSTRSRARPAAAESRSASRAAASSSRAATTENGWDPTVPSMTGRERGRRRLRIVLGKPQRRQGGAYLWVPALVFVQRGGGSFDAFGLARP